MAKETKAERTLREGNERSMYLAEQEATYLPRLMAAMQRARAANFELEVQGMSFVLRNRNDRDYDANVLELEYSQSANDTLDELEWQVKRVEEREAEANRKFLAKQCALAKLSKEEKELLGL
jgi:hypothetical protein